MTFFRRQTECFPTMSYLCICITVSVLWLHPECPVQKSNVLIYCTQTCCESFPKNKFQICQIWLFWSQVILNSKLYTTVHRSAILYWLPLQLFVKYNLIVTIYGLSIAFIETPPLQSFMMDSEPLLHHAWNLSQLSMTVHFRWLLSSPSSALQTNSWWNEQACKHNKFLM